MSDLVERVARATYDAEPWLDERDRLMTWEALDPRDRKILCVEAIPAITATLEAMLEWNTELDGELVCAFAIANGIKLGEKG